MTRLARTSCVVGVLAVIVVAGATPQVTRMISVERQLRLQRRVLLGEQSLLATLEANRQRWQQLEPSQQDSLRQRAYAFRGADAQQQQRIIAAWEKFHRLSQAQQQEYRRRAEWVKAVVDGLDDSQRQRLLEMSPEQRARELLRLGRQTEGAAAVDDEQAAPAPPSM